MKIQGKVCLITGGAQGLGKGFAEAILERGGQVCIADIQVKQGLGTAHYFEQQYGPGAAIFVRCDVTIDRDIQNAFDKTQRIFGRLDIVVNNAGLASHRLWTKLIAVNLRAVILGNKMAVERMARSNDGNGGVIVNIASVAGTTMTPYLNVYSATKHGVVGLTRSLGGTLAETPQDGVRVVCICPSFTRTPGTDLKQVRQLIDKIKNSSDPELMDSSMDMIDVDDVVKGFLEVIRDDDNQGGVMEVIPEGLRYKYPRRLTSRL